MHHITWFGQTTKIPRGEIDKVIELIERLRKAKIEFHHVFWD